MDREEGEPALMSLPKQLLAATLLVSAAAGALILASQSDSSGESEASPAAIPSRAPLEAEDSAKEEATPSAKVGAPDALVAFDPNSARALVPPDAWIVADFRGDITGHLPFSDQEGECAKVLPPTRVAVAILPPKNGQSPDMLLAAPQVSESFWACAVARIEAAGGGILAENDIYQVFKSPSGLVAKGPENSMVFITSEAHLESALSVLSRLAPGASSKGPHGELLRRMHPEGASVERAELDLTLSLPKDWLSAVGQDVEKSPLRHIESAYVTAREDGSALGAVDCDEAGCAEVLAFLNRAKGDILRSLPARVKAGIESSLKAEHVAGTGRIAITWSPVGLQWGKLLGGLLGGHLLK